MRAAKRESLPLWMLLLALPFTCGDVVWSEQLPPRVIYRGAGADTWVPATEEIVELEQLLSQAFAKAAKERASRADGPRLLDRYGIQYRGVLRHGTKHIAGFGFCKNHGRSKAHLETELFIVKDGGTCYFNFEYDPALKTFLYFAFNGEA